MERLEDYSRVGGRHRLKCRIARGEPLPDELPWNVPRERLAELKAQVSAHEYIADPAQISHGIVSFALAA